jgi:hypothetical protein
MLYNHVLILVGTLINMEKLRLPFCDACKNLAETLTLEHDSWLSRICIAFRKTFIFEGKLPPTDGSTYRASGSLAHLPT